MFVRLMYFMFEIVAKDEHNLILCCKGTGGWELLL